MKHISEIVAIKKTQIEHARQLSLFVIPRAKGSSEWKIFSSPIMHDHSDTYRVAAPRRFTLQRFPAVLEINRYIRQLRQTPKFGL